MDVIFCRVKFFSRAWRSVLLPTLGGPTIATTTGGGSTGVRSTSGICCFFVSKSWALDNETLGLTPVTKSESMFHLWKRFWAFTADWIANALGFRCRASCSWTWRFLAFFLSALRPIKTKYRTWNNKPRSLRYTVRKYPITQSIYTCSAFAMGFFLIRYDVLHRQKKAQCLDSEKIWNKNIQNGTRWVL